MVAHIDILGIGDRQVGDSNIEMETLEEYQTIAKKTIASFAPTLMFGLAEEMLKNEDAIANVAHAIMMADWQFDGRGTIFGFRKERAKYAIKSYLSRRSKNVNKNVLRLDNIVDSNNSDNSYTEFLESKEQSHENAIQDIEMGKFILSRMDDLVKTGVISDKGVRLIKMKYMDDLSMTEIASIENTSRQAVYDMINRTITLVRESVE